MPSLPMVGDDLAGYRLRSVLGRGGMSVVFEAENPRLGSTVALKVLAPEIAMDDVFRARFLQESRIAASLNHPNVIPIYDVGPCDDLLYIAMRYVAGSDLRAVLRSHRRISPAQALLLVGQAARALDVAHRRGLVHRDVKPGNILVEQGYDEDDPDHVYLADFGIAKHAMSRSGLTATGEFVGTIDYIAPEQIKDKSVDGRADEYSLGCVLYECLTGRVPFIKDIDAAVIWAHVEESPAPPSTIRPDLPPGIDDVLARALAKEPSERYPTCREFISAASAALAPVAGEPQTVLSHRRDSTAAHRRADSPGPGSPGGPGAIGPGHTERPPGAQPPGAQPPSDVPEPPRRAHGGRRRVAVLGAVALIIAAAIGAWAISHRGTAGSSSPAARGSSSSPAVPHAGTSLMTALSAANTVTHGLLPPAWCHAANGGSVVKCTDPDPSLAAHDGISTIKFQTFPTLGALYKNYVSEVKQISQASFHQNFKDCNYSTNGEVSWNHSKIHSRRYKLAQLSSPAWNAIPRNSDNAAGRVFCTDTQGSRYSLAWTQNGDKKVGNLLGVLTGVPHQSWNWWKDFHHHINFSPGSTMGNM